MPRHLVLAAIRRACTLDMSGRAVFHVNGIRDQGALAPAWGAVAIWAQVWFRSGVLAWATVRFT